jgi:hypothetical protein
MENNISIIHEKVYSQLTENLSDQKLRFTLRERNRADRIEKGYWFSGNDNYLVFSFWTGKDWRNKTPNIYFSITKEGDCKLEFISYDDIGKIIFFNNVAEALGMQQKTRARSGDTFEHWVKNYKGNDYILALDDFLKRDKKIIDAFILSNNLGHLFEPISEDEFKKNKKRIDAQRRKIRKLIEFRTDYEEVKSITLNSLKISNISLFANPNKISFHKNLTCFIGLNGTGKTSILRALVLAFTGYEQNETMGIEDSELLTSRLRNLLHINGITKMGSPQYASKGFAEIYYSIESTLKSDNSTLYHNKVVLSSENNDPQVSDDSESDFRNITDDKYKSLFLAFPQLQEEEKEKNSDKNIFFPHISDAISMLNNKPDNRFGAFADWLRGLNNLANEKQAKGEAIPLERSLLKEVFEIISEVTGETITLDRIVVTENSKHPIWVKIGENSSPILFDLISQGYNNVFGWIGYFMKRLKEVTPSNETDFTKTPAIVLIDEIDTYLHPLWQTKILEVLVRRFPNVQFVVTTHSPYIIGSIPGDKIKVYTCLKNVNIVDIEPFEEFNAYGANIEKLSEKLFGVNGRFVSDVKERFKKLSDLINNSELAEAKEYLSSYFTDIDDNDSELQRSKMLIRTKEILAK